MNILIIQGAKLGDMVCTTPMFRAVKQKYPTSYLIVMGDAINKEIVAGNPYINEYVVLPKNWQGIKLFLKRKKIDYACITSPNPTFLLALLLSRIPHVIVPKIEGGFSPYATKTYRLLSLFATRVPHTMSTYAPREYLRLLEPLDIVSDDTSKDIFIESGSTKRVNDMLQASGVTVNDFLIGVSPGVGNKIKLWSGKNFSEVSVVLQKKYNAKLVLIGGSRDKEQVDIMLAQLPSTCPVLDYSGKMSIEDLKALIKKLNIFISVDTGPIYIAEALNVPTVDIVGPMDEREQPPRSAIHRVVVAPRKAPAIHIMNAAVFDVMEARRQSESISVDMVITEASSLIDSLNSKK